jgi:hypothetical protein
MVLPSSACCRPAGAGIVIASARFAISDIAESSAAAAAIARQNLRIDSLLGMFCLESKKLRPNRTAFSTAMYRPCTFKLIAHCLNSRGIRRSSLVHPVSPGYLIAYGKTPDSP